MYLLESPRRGVSNKYTKRMIYNRKTVQRYPFTDAIKFLYNSTFDFTAKPLVTNAVVTARVLCRLILRRGPDYLSLLK